MSVRALRLGFARGDFSPADIAAQALDAASRLRALNAFVHLDGEAVRAQARASTERWRRGAQLSPLDGIPVAIKDLIDVAGSPTGAGTNFLREPARADAEMVARLRRAGAILFGKTHLAECALAPSGLNPWLGPAQNPWRRGWDTGGSSSGSAAAVAAGIVPLALGTDLGGSLRIPAALCGAAALKPSFGRLPMWGIFPLAPSLDHVGPIGAELGDVIELFALLDGAPFQPDLPRRRLRVGIDRRWWRAADSESCAAVSAALAKIDCEQVETRVQHVELALEIGALICNAELARALSHFPRERFGPSVRVALALGRAVPPSLLAEADRARARLSAALDAALASCDVLVTPTTGCAARPYAPTALARGELDEETFRRRTAFTFPANLARLPAAQVPCGRSANGLPLGLQVIAPRGRDHRALAVAALVEQAI